jgi:hypothetical protein
LRFARVRRYRPDKDVADADTIDALRELLRGSRLSRDTVGMDPLPMAIDDCSLDSGELARQAERYGRLGAVAASVNRSDRALRIELAEDAPLDLLERTIAVERGCCPFLSLSLDAGALTIAIEDDTHTAVLDAIEAALAGAR